MITAEDIRDALLSSMELGTYTFRSSGLTTPAIRVDDGSEPYSEEPDITGLEVVIQPAIEVPVSLLMGGYQQTFGHLITLKQWDINHTTLEAMETAIATLNAFDTLTVGKVVRVPRRDVLNNIETLKMAVSEVVYESGGTL